MTPKHKTWLIWTATAGGLITASLFAAAFVVARHFEPYIRAQTIDYLQKRFDSDVEIRALRVRVPKFSSLRMLLTHRGATIARIEADGIVMRHRGRRDIPPLFSMKSVSFQVNPGLLFQELKSIRHVVVDGMEINVPPKGERFGLGLRPQESGSGAEAAMTSVTVEDVLLTNSTLAILRSDKKKLPLQFDLYRVRLESAGLNVAMKYEASISNPRPPGDILSQGTFGPWSADEPSVTPLAGEYSFDNADLGVFSGIAGTLHSTGSFHGTLSSVDVAGEAVVPDFRLKRAGSPLRLATKFQAIVDGTNGDTILRPVTATLGSTTFTTSGGIIKHDAANRRAVSLNVSMPKGNLQDLLRLAMKGTPLMAGEIAMDAKIDIPPLSGKVREKLILAGRFEIRRGKFLKSTIQDQIDTLSRRGQGQPKNMEIDQVISQMAGTFRLEDEIMTFKPVSFSVPGSGIDLSGTYDLDGDTLDFRGALKLQARISQTMTGWKHWVLKPLDPFFSKDGAGTLLQIKVEGSAGQPRFGLNR